VEIDVVDPEGKVVAVGLQGEIRTRGWLVMAGYHLDPEATARAISDDGWLHSGDLGTMDADGYLRVTGRAKDMVIRGGENIYPTEIEAALREFGDVTDAQVVGVPDVRYGEVCAAFLRMAPGAAELSYEDMKARLDGRLARYKVPAYLRTVEDFPVTPSGKVQKFKLREQLLAELEVSA
jgi:acyl-CoA synthetase (AMP-forming)/AMP-acid ligase II